MDIDEDDDFYAPEEPDVPETEPVAAAPSTSAADEAQNEDLEEGEEEDEGGDMDEDDDSIDIVTERKDQAPPIPQSRYSEIRNIPQRSTSHDTAVKAAPVKGDDARASASGAEHPPVSASKVDVNAIPIHKGTGKPITQVNIDEDLAEHDKPWRKPGTDLSDYFNYGFDEFTWTLYAQKQEALRGEYSQEAVAQNNKKMMEDMTNMLMMGMIPGMPGAAAGAGAAASGGGGGGGSGASGAGNASAGAGAGAGAGPAMPGMEGMPPEMQAMMQQMMAGGMDPSQMDPSAMSAMFASMQGGAGGGAGGQGQNFGAGFGGGQGQGFGYDQQQQMGGGGNRGNFGGAGGGGGRGRGGRRNW